MAHLPTLDAQHPSSIHPATTLGLVTLAVANAARSIGFYRDLLGFELLVDDGARLQFGAGGQALLELQVQPGLRPKPRRTTGLYHVAFVVPTRRDLAHVLQRIMAAHYPLGASDHLVSEALYLSDPDGNGLEIYRDRPRETWRTQPNGELMMDTLPLDLADVLKERTASAAHPPAMAAGTRVGHMHLQVADLAQAQRFYGAVLGFDVMVRIPGALFLGAGGYHHHFGLNIWESANAPTPPADVAGLRLFTIELPSVAALNFVRERIVAAEISFHEAATGLTLADPWDNQIVLQVASIADSQTMLV